MAETTVVIEGVFTNGPFNGKFGEFHRYDVKGGGKKFQTIKDALAEKARSLKGQSAKVTYHEETRGEYTNLVIDSIEASGGAAKPSQDEFRRSKEEMRRTEAFHIAATLGAEDLAQLTELGDAIANVLASTGQEAPEEKQF